MTYDIEKIKKGIEPAILLFFHSLDSTNQHVLTHGSQWDLQYPLLVVAETQTAGQGRQGKNWFSRSGNLTFSWTLESKLSLAELGTILPILPLQVAYVVRQVLQEFIETPTIQVQIKWPNDLILQGKKMGGILIQTQPRGLGSLVCIGIGINVNAAFDRDYFPAALTGLQATSVWEETGKNTSLSDLVIALANQLHRSIGNIDGDFDFNARQLEPHLFGLGSPARLVNGDIQVAGIVRGVESNGDLLLETDGQVHRYGAGSLCFPDEST